jgi:hypothetical protein
VRLVLLCVQFPLADVRPFVLGETHALGRPSFYVRRAGIEQDRLGGGVDEWPAEDEYWLALNTLRFCDRLDRRSFGEWMPAGFGGAFRRLFWDEPFLPRCRVELAITNTGGGRDQRRFTARSAPCFNARTIRPLLHDFLTMPVRIPRRGQLSEHRLCTAAKPVSQLVLASTTRWRDADLDFAPERWWVQAGHPMCLVEYGYNESGEPPAGAREIASSTAGFTLHFFRLPVGHTVWPIWFLRIDSEPQDPAVRLIRLYLLRLHAETETLRTILELLADERQAALQPSGRFSALDAYLEKALGLLSRDAHYGHRTSELLANAYGYSEQAQPTSTRIAALAEQAAIRRPRLGVLLRERRKAVELLERTEPDPTCFPDVEGD